MIRKLTIVIYLKNVESNIKSKHKTTKYALNLSLNEPITTAANDNFCDIYIDVMEKSLGISCEASIR